MTGRRDQALDGLRGIAALAVAFSHVPSMSWLPFIDGGESPWSAWEDALWHLGAPAVDLFFVLSGYVVASSLLRRPRPWVDYMLGRATRLLPIAWAAVMVGLAVRALQMSPPSGTTVGLRELATPLVAGDVVGFMTMVAPMPNLRAVNPPLWSMMVEMQVALVMPLLALAARRSPAWTAFGGAAACLVVGISLNLVYPLLFPGFLVGAALASAEPRIPAPPRPGIALWACLAALLVRHWLGSDDPFLRTPCAFIAAGLILSVRAGGGRALLEGGPARWLGRISYPLYAVHWPVMAGFVLAFGSVMGVPAAALASIPVSLAIATILEVAIDRHAVSLSRLVGGAR